MIVQLCASEGLKRESIRSRARSNFAAIRQRWRPVRPPGSPGPSDSPNQTRASSLPRVMAGHLRKEAANSVRPLRREPVCLGDQSPRQPEQSPRQEWDRFRRQQP